MEGEMREERARLEQWFLDIMFRTRLPVPVVWHLLASIMIIMFIIIVVVIIRSYIYMYNFSININIIVISSSRRRRSSI